MLNYKLRYMPVSLFVLASIVLLSACSKGSNESNKIVQYNRIVQYEEAMITYNDTNYKTRHATATYYASKDSLVIDMDFSNPFPGSRQRYIIIRLLNPRQSTIGTYYEIGRRNCTLTRRGFNNEEEGSEDNYIIYGLLDRGGGGYVDVMEFYVIRAYVYGYFTSYANGFNHTRSGYFYLPVITK